MKKSILFLPLLLVTISLWGQVGERVQAMKVAYITNRVGLNTEESEKFWPIYNEFEKKEKDLRSQYRFNGNLMSISEEEADQYIQDNFEMEGKLLELKKQFYQDLRAFLNPRKILLFRKAEREFNVELLKTLKERRMNNRFRNNRD